MENNRSPNLNRLGAVYGLLWGVVALAVLKSLGGDFFRMTGWYLLGSIPTGILVTRLLAGRLGKTEAWKVWTYGPAALLLGTLGFAFFLGLLCLAADVFAGRTPNLHDSLVLFYWCPFVAFGALFPIGLAALNCWDLRRRLASLAPA